MYDGLHHYTFDAWNRLTMVRNAVSAADSDSSGVIEPDEVATGSIQAVYHYDGLNRRTLAQIDLARDSSGGIVTDGNNDPLPLSDLAAGYHDYYNGWSAIETRNGSEQVIKQQVWGTQYIDELCQIAVNDDPSDENEDDCETTYYALTGSTYNIDGLVDSTGEFVERYEYTPYGQRQVYSSCGDNDPALMNPLPISQRVQVSSEDQPYGLCEFGHQGLMHDEATPGLVNNRNRIYLTDTGRFAQRDPIGYPDGLNPYAGYHILHGGVDPSGHYFTEDVPSDGLNSLGRGTRNRWLPNQGDSLGKVKIRYRGSSLCTGHGKVYLDIVVKMSDRTMNASPGKWLRRNAYGYGFFMLDNQVRLFFGRPRPSQIKGVLNAVKLSYPAYDEASNANWHDGYKHEGDLWMVQYKAGSKYGYDPEKLDRNPGLNYGKFIGDNGIILAFDYKWDYSCCTKNIGDNAMSFVSQDESLNYDIETKFSIKDSPLNSYDDGGIFDADKRRDIETWKPPLPPSIP